MDAKDLLSILKYETVLVVSLDPLDYLMAIIGAQNILRIFIKAHCPIWVHYKLVVFVNWFFETKVRDIILVVTIQKSIRHVRIDDVIALNKYGQSVLIIYIPKTDILHKS